MRFTLKDYQTEAAAKILTTLGYAREDWHKRERRTAFALSSTTGSGKTVIAASVIEALLHGSDEFDVEADPSAVVLWVSKDPSLNAQTKSRFIECADRIPVGDLVLLDKTYAEESLQTGAVYFINPDKLGKNADFVKHTDDRHVTFWEILTNTIQDEEKTLYMVLDEAHEGMKDQSSGDQTIVQKIINGNGVNPAVPVVWGISATVKRFDQAMERADAFTKEKNVVIDPKDVQNSGLLKNALTLDIPDEDGDFSTTMVREATLDFVEVCERWDAYCDEQGIDPVVPLMVAQIPNKMAGEKDTEKGRREEDELIRLVLETIRKHWPDMPTDSVAHVLGDRATIEIGAYEIPKVAPQDVQHTHGIRVLLAKDAVSTGWDCPRAEVLVSLRPAREDTYVTQLLGRMVRTPLAQETSVERLNAASCYLPHFDKETAKRVAEEIMGMREPRSGERGAAVNKVMLKPITLQRNQDVHHEVFQLIQGIPSFAKPAAAPRPVKRILKAAQALAQDELIPDADKIAHEAMFDVLDIITEANKVALAAQAKKIVSADVRRILVERGEDEATDSTDTRDADAATVDDALRHLRRLITASAVNRYLSRNMQAAINEAYKEAEDPAAVDITAIRARVAALAFIDTEVQKPVEDAADSLTQFWLTTKAKDIASLPDSRRPTYEAIQDMAREPEQVAIEIKTDERVDSVDTDLKPLPTEKKHLLATANGDYPLELKMAKNRWERATIQHERELGTLEGWYRNPSAAGKNSLRIAHKSGNAWKSVQPDFVFAHSKDGELLPSLVDPHGAHLGDSAPKLKALAEYADEHGDKFDRIIAVGIEKDNVLYGLDLKSSKIRRAVYESAADSDSIRRLYGAYGTKYATVPADF
ncbi:DEAD/DEAH box helicase family protein [Arthrobacter sp. AL08]|uniref:DEAD/DEAH box helicase n=1 Tax=unclassified Arthrobacter TaxID=235627 RepID=UPI00249B33BD|nr:MULTISPECIES: DEAD/DEAH box helicase family protein [unclassified Arthrobacter]MDI3243032.1 DEAD/DEAH box helicase family protein [Arthrobacter sp. AL05]MDI3279042.1 DEAD/DEAH box helicase family protein [Arthrobacter sp. AL08]